MKTFPKIYRKARVWMKPFQKLTQRIFSNNFSFYFAGPIIAINEINDLRLRSWLAVKEIHPTERRKNSLRNQTPSKCPLICC